ncbi:MULTISPECIES: cupredoxin domain-containing protein [unclassified Geodermatophilus]|uniref:cupredoxin domain-containing protein n=1 Tax=unclassified Geodermatophilus TaxID=2637632 RepID=UPI003EF00C3F
MSHRTRSTAPVRRRTAALALVAVAGLLGACGGDDGGDTGATESTTSSSAAETSSSAAATSAPAESEAVTVNAVDFSFELSEDSYAAGTYTFDVTNSGQMPHNFAVERDGETVAATEVLQPGGTATLEATLEAGDYFFYCAVGQHRANGMEVPVTVTA